MDKEHTRYGAAGVSRGAIQAIHAGRNWRHLG